MDGLRGVNHHNVEYVRFSIQTRHEAYSRVDNFEFGLESDWAHVIQNPNSLSNVDNDENTIPDRCIDRDFENESAPERITQTRESENDTKSQQTRCDISGLENNGNKIKRAPTLVKAKNNCQLDWGWIASVMEGQGYEINNKILAI